MSDFENVTAVRRRAGAGPTVVYDATLDPGWAIGGKPNGGYLLAVLARAGCDAVGAAHPRAISAHYLRAPSGGPAEVRTEVIRLGRRASTCRATLWQDDKICLDATVTCGELHRLDLPAADDSSADTEYAGRPAPVVPPPEDCVDPRHPHFSPEIFEHVELRLDPTTAPFPDPTGTPEIRFWARLRDGAPADALALILTVDAGPPTVFNLQRYGWAPTVELTVMLRSLPAPGWLLCETRTDAVADGWFDETAAVWDSTGRLVAQSTQLAIVGGRRQLPS